MSKAPLYRQLEREGICMIKTSCSLRSFRGKRVNTEVNFKGGGHSLGVVAGAAPHASQMKSILLIGGDCPLLFYKRGQSGFSVA